MPAEKVNAPNAVWWLTSRGEMGGNKDIRKASVYKRPAPAGNCFTLLISSDRTVRWDWGYFLPRILNESGKHAVIPVLFHKLLV